jgi:hypothetical protein
MTNEQIIGVDPSHGYDFGGVTLIRRKDGAVMWHKPYSWWHRLSARRKKMYLKECMYIIEDEYEPSKEVW